MHRASIAVNSERPMEAGHVAYSVIVPVYNSEKSLIRLNSELHETMDSLGYHYELLYVDDCSADGSWQVLRSLHSESDHVHIIRLAGNVGQLTALICGVHHAKGEHIITIDDDLEYDTFDIARLVEYYRANEYLIVYAMPKGKDRKNLSYRLFFKVRNRILNFLLGKRPSEGFRVFNRRIMAGRDGRIDTSLHLDAFEKLALHRRFIGHIEVGYRPRPFGRSGHGLLKKIGIISKFGLEYLPSPLKLYIYLGMAVLAVSIVLALVPLDVFGTTLPLAAWTLGFQALMLVGMGLLGYYASTLHLRFKGRPDYVIMEEQMPTSTHMEE